VSKLRLAPLWSMMRKNNEEPTMAFTTRYTAHFLAAGETPTAEAKDARESETAAAWWNGLGEAEQTRWNKQMGFP
jgi:hypothetical protein